MTEKEYLAKMRALGYSEDEIAECQALRREAAEKGIVIPYEADIIERPYD